MDRYNVFEISIKENDRDILNAVKRNVESFKAFA